MVASTGLGLFNASLGIIGGAGVAGQKTLGRGSSRAFVNATNGNPVLQMLDVQLAGRGLSLYAPRTCHSLAAATDGDRYGWRCSVRVQCSGSREHRVTCPRRDNSVKAAGCQDEQVWNC
jgi:hypothetical protein